MGRSLTGEESNARRVSGVDRRLWIGVWMVKSIVMDAIGTRRSGGVGGRW